MSNKPQTPTEQPEDNTGSENDDNQVTNKPNIPNNEIWYTTTDGKKLFPPTTEPAVFGAILVSNTYSDGKGVLTFDDDITLIGDSAFKDCSNLTSVTISDSVTAIGNYAFSGCSNLTSVTIPDSVTSIGKHAFYNCSSLTSVYISDLSAWCRFSFEDYSSNPLYYAGNLYLNNELVTDLVIPSDITEIKSYAFIGCSSLTSITIPDSVTSIGGCTFYNCSSLTSITIPDGVTTIGGSTFFGCSSLTSITIPDSVTTIREWAFDGCSSLKSVYITDLSAWCKIDFGNDCANPLYYAKNLYLNNELVTDLVIPSDITDIKSYAFYNCRSLTSLTIPDGVTTIGWHAFYGCTGELIVNCNIPSESFRYSAFTSVTIGDSVTTIGYCAFKDCSSLTNVTIPDSVTEIGDYAFYDCSSLTSLTIPDGVTSIGYKAFYGCTGELIVNCNIPSASSESDGAFYGSKFTSVTIGDSVTKIGNYAFDECRSLTSVTIGDSVTTIGENAFAFCSSLREFNGKYASEDGRCLILNGVLYAFARYGITEYTIPDSVTTIGNYAFYYCNSLTSVIIGSGVTTIRWYAFYRCDSLTSVYCKATTPPAGGSEMFNYNASGRKIYVPTESVEAYKSASGWKNYASDIVGYNF